MSATEQVVQKLGAVLPEGSVTADESYRMGVAYTIRTPLEKLAEAAAAFNDAGFYLDTITALDFEDTFELVYHFNCYEPKSRIALRALCGHEQSAPSLTGIFESAQWQEREVHEFFGIPFAGHPDLRPLLLPEDADYHPLKKTFGKVQAYRKREEIYA